MNLDAYRIFTDDDGTGYLVAKKVGDEIEVICVTEDYDRAVRKIFDDAGLRVQVLERELDDEGEYCPEPEDWE